MSLNPWKCLPVYFHFDADNALVGLWCEDCNLPSAIRIPILSLSETGVNEVGFYDACMDCGEFDDEEGEDDDYDTLVCG